VIARVDARDGVIEWLSTYSRTTPNAHVIGFLRREGAAPLVSGSSVVCIPRDYEGAFGLNKETAIPMGKSVRVVAAGRRGVQRRAILSDTDYAVSLDASTGKLRWFRSFNGEISARPVSDGASIFVADQKSDSSDIDREWREC